MTNQERHDINMRIRHYKSKLVKAQKVLAEDKKRVRELEMVLRDLRSQLKKENNLLIDEAAEFPDEDLWK
jgi:hypothetical protein